MRFFELDEEKTVHLNKVWIQMIPEFKALLTRDKGSQGDYDGRHKLRARRDFTFIYFFSDFNSPIRDWEDIERQKEACYYAGLEEKTVANDDALWIAVRKYEELLLKGSRSLRTYKALLKAQDALDEYYENLDFTEIDRQGKLLHDPASITASADKLDKFSAAIKKFGKAVEEELKEGGSKIRGTAEKGENEDNVRKWSEGDIAAQSDRLRAKSNAPNFKSLSKQIKKVVPATELQLDQEDSSGEDWDGTYEVL
jgi:hypothetical protein